MLCDWSICWSNGDAFVSGARGPRFKSRAGEIRHSVANGSPSLPQFFERSCFAQAKWLRWVLTIRYTLRRVYNERYDLIYHIPVVFFQSIILLPRGGAKFTVRKNGTISISWKLTVCRFPYGLFVLEYADSSNPRDFFLHSSLVLRYVQSNLSNTRDLKKLRKSKLFASMLLSFSPRVCFWSTNKEWMMALGLKQYCDPWAAKTFLGCFRSSFDGKCDS